MEIMVNPITPKCKICYEYFNTKDRIPTILPSCGHSVCQICFTKLVVSVNKPKCPFDNDSICTQKMVKNHELLDVIESLNQSTKLPEDQKKHPLQLIKVKKKCIKDGKLEKVFGCDLCKYYLCFNCCGIKWSDKECVIGHKTKWVKKNYQCVKCDFNKTHGLDCLICANFTLCLNCSNYTFPLDYCPNNHILEWNSEDKQCDKCSTVWVGMGCFLCSYFLCSLNCYKLNFNNNNLNNQVIQNEKRFQKLNTINVPNIIICMLKLTDNLFATGHQNGFINIWNFNNYSLLHTFKSFTTSNPDENFVLFMVLISNSENLLFACINSSSYISIWNYSNTPKIIVSFFCAHSRNISGLASIDPNLICTSAYDGSIKIWQYYINPKSNPKLLKILDCDSVNCIMNFNNNYLISGHDELLNIWDINNRELLYSRDYFIVYIKTLNDENFIAGNSNFIYIMNASSGMELQNFQIDYSDIVTFLKLNDSQLAILGENNIDIFNLQKAKRDYAIDFTKNANHNYLLESEVVSNTSNLYNQDFSEENEENEDDEYNEENEDDEDNEENEDYEDNEDNEEEGDEDYARFTSAIRMDDNHFIVGERSRILIISKI